MRKTYLARSSKTGLHHVLRAVPASFLSAHSPVEPFTEAFNALASSNNVLELLEAVDRLPLLVPSESLGGERRVFDADEAASLARRGWWLPCRGDMLEHEAHFDAGVPPELGNRKRATNAALRHRDALLVGLDDLLSVACKETSYVADEPLLDWTFARNVLGMTARLLGALSSKWREEALERSGFVRDHSKPLKTDVYRAPFAFNPFFTEGVAFLMDYAKLNPLMERMLTIEKPRAGLGPLKWTFAEGENVYIVTAPVATGRRYPLFQSRSNISEKRYYLVVEDHGESQSVLAESCVRALARAAMELEGSDGAPLGWKFDDSSLVDGSAAPSFSRKSLLPDLMYQLVYRASRAERISTCVQCGNAILISQGPGKPRMFCSSACRMRHQRESKE